MTRSIIRVEHLSKTYTNHVKAVDDISFEVFEGEIFGLLGPNGAGKTTTLEIIETLRLKTSGTVIVDDLDIDTHPFEVKERIGIQLQSAGFYPKLNLIETINMFAALYGKTVNPLELLVKVNLTEKAKSQVDQLSGGQKQRFSIATTLVNTPKIIFLDEPTTGLDPQARINLWELMQDIRSQGTTIVITTHYMEEAEKLCDRIGIMDEGRILQLDTPAKLINDLLDTGFKKEHVVRQADLEDVFITLTGKALRDT